MKRQSLTRTTLSHHDETRVYTDPRVQIQEPNQGRMLGSSAAKSKASVPKGADELGPPLLRPNQLSSAPRAPSLGNVGQKGHDIVYQLPWG